MIVAPTPGLLERVERRTAYQLAGLEVPDDTTTKWGPDGTSTVREQPPLPSGRELLAQLVQEGRSLSDHAVQVAREAAMVELLVSRESPGE